MSMYMKLAFKWFRKRKRLSVGVMWYVCVHIVCACLCVCEKEELGVRKC